MEDQCLVSLLSQLSEQQQSWPVIASYISTVAWSISFYGQVYENYKFKSVQGFSLDYLMLNIIGYTFYGIYSTIGYFTDIKGAGTVLLPDLIFVYHAIPVVIFQVAQCLYYPRGNNTVSKQAKIFGAILVFLVLSQFFFTSVFHVIQWTQYWNPVSALGYGKLIISFVKYSPAVYWNYKRKSTKGWSIFNIILDLVGGSFSLASGSISVSNGLNVTKLMLAILTVFYDLIFVFQHYVLYRKKLPIHKVYQNPLLKDTNDDEGYHENSIIVSDEISSPYKSQEQIRYQNSKCDSSDSK